MRVEKSLLLVILVFPLLAAIDVVPSVASIGDFMIDTDLLHSMVVDNTRRAETGQKKKFFIVDARTIEEYKEAHVAGAVSIPEKDFEKSHQFLQQDKNALMVVYCNDKRCVRSRRWAAKAAAAGYTNVVIYADGFPYWKERNMPIAYEY